MLNVVRRRRLKLEERIKNIRRRGMSNSRVYGKGEGNVKEKVDYRCKRIEQ